jgi:hypothetical protein
MNEEAWSMEHGAGSREQGAWSREQGAGSMGAWGIEKYLKLQYLLGVISYNLEQHKQHEQHEQQKLKFP